MKSIFTGCILICLCFVVQAQDDKDTLLLNPKIFVLDEMVVSASRWEQNLREVPNKISKIGSSLVQFQNPQTAADLLALSNNVFVQKSQLGGGSPMIRGFATNRVLLVVDGVRMNNAIFRSGNLQNVISLDVNSIENAEVIFGPGSVIYGSDAIGGVMDFHTLSPMLAPADKHASFSARAMARYSSANNEKTFHTDFNVGLKRWGFCTSVTYADYNDLHMGSNGPEEYTRPDYVVRENGVDVMKLNSDPDVQVPSGYKQFNGMQKVSFQPSASWELTYGFQYSKTSDYPRYDRLLLRNGPNLTSAEWYYGPQKWLMHSLSIDNSTQTAISDHSRLIVAYQDYEESRHNRNFQNARRTNRYERVKAMSVNLDLDNTLSTRLSLYYGVEAVMNEVGSTAFRNNVDNGEITEVSTRYPDGSVWRTYAAYGSLKYKINTKWLLNASGRLTYVYTHAKFDNTFFDFPFTEATVENTAWNGSLGMIFNPAETWKVYSNLSSGFRAPNVDDIGKVFDSQPGNVVVPNPDLEPEKAYGAEIGSVGKLGNNFTIDFSVYYTNIDNAIARGPSTFNGEDSIVYDGGLSRVLSQQNISQLYVYGFQASFDWFIVDELQFTSNINWQKGKEKDPETEQDFSPTHVAPMFGATHLIFKKNKMKVDLYANYNGEISYANLALTERADSRLYAKDEDGNPYAPSWWTLNLKGSYRVMKNITVDVGVENLLDKRYRPYSSGITAPGINFIGSLRLNI